MHQQSLKPVIGVVGKRNVRGTRLTRRIKERGMPELSRVISEPPAPALRMHIAPHTRDAKLARQSLHVSGIRIRIGTQVVVHMHRDHTPARGSPPRDRGAHRKEHA